MLEKIVPNAPCGVERYLQDYHFRICFLFLMHRVELKAFIVFSSSSSFSILVPNAPCGVERPQTLLMLCSYSQFLMHRVELKAEPVLGLSELSLSFLMHRVELKVIVICKFNNDFIKVPNAPCGVESHN